MVAYRRKALAAFTTLAVSLCFVLSLPFLASIGESSGLFDNGSQSYTAYAYNFKKGYSSAAVAKQNVATKNSKLYLNKAIYFLKNAVHEDSLNAISRCAESAEKYLDKASDAIYCAKYCPSKNCFKTKSAYKKKNAVFHKYIMAVIDAGADAVGAQTTISYSNARSEALSAYNRALSAKVYIARCML